MRLPSVPEHELFANSFLLEGEIADALRDDWAFIPATSWRCSPSKPRDAKSRILASMLSGPIDIDKMDYLYRDSLHAGVPYGRNFDQRRLIGSLCLNEAGDGLAITDKGKTAAEMMVFARYVMFSEVYWHHGVRCGDGDAPAGVLPAARQLDLDAHLPPDRSADDRRCSCRRRSTAAPRANCLQGCSAPPRLYKRLAQYSYLRAAARLFRRLARRPYPWLAACAEQFAAEASTALGRVIAPHEILFDAPPVAREVEFNVDVYFPKQNAISPAGRSLARRPHAAARSSTTT